MVKPAVVMEEDFEYSRCKTNQRDTFFGKYIRIYIKDYQSDFSSCKLPINCLIKICGLCYYIIN